MVINVAESLRHSALMGGPLGEERGGEENGPSRV